MIFGKFEWSPKQLGNSNHLFNFFIKTYVFHVSWSNFGLDVRWWLHPHHACSMYLHFFLLTNCQKKTKRHFFLPPTMFSKFTNMSFFFEISGIKFEKICSILYKASFFFTKITKLDFVWYEISSPFFPKKSMKISRFFTFVWIEPAKTVHYLNREFGMH